jgi:hypothetical protein
MTPTAPAPSHSRFAIGAAVGVVLLLGGCSSAAAPTADSSIARVDRAVSDVLAAIDASVVARVGEPVKTAEPTALEAVCIQAQDYLDAHQYAEALALIDSVRKPAREVLEPLPTNTPVVDAALACDVQRTLAVLGLDGESPEPKTAIESFGATWDAAVKSWLVPLQGSGVALLALWTAILVLARLLVFVPRPTFAKWSRLLSLVSLVSGIAATLYFPVELLLLVNRLGTPASPNEFLLWAIARAVAGCVYASVALALFLGGSNRMTVTSSDDEATSPLQAGIVSRLGALGPSGARDLEVPKGTGIPSDVVKSLLPALAGNAFVTGIQTAARTLLGVAPWHVDFRAIDSERSIVNITRNGHGFASATIDLDKLGLPKKHESVTDFPSKMAVAVVLAAMARTHTDFDGVAGATDWRSIGLHDIATTLFEEDDALATQVLGRALDYDPKNVRAEIALELLLRRKSTDADSIYAYFTWLGTKVDQLREDGWNRRGYLDLRRQVLLSYLAVGRNLLAKYNARRANVSPTNTWKRVSRWGVVYLPLWRSIASLIGPLVVAPTYPVAGPISHRPANSDLIDRAAELRGLLRFWRHPSGGFRDRVRPIAATTIAVLHRKYVGESASARLDRMELFTRSWLREASVSESPQTAYAFACFIARIQDFVPPGDELPTALAARLRIALLDPENKKWALSDPELNRLRRVEAFRVLVLEDKTPTDFWKIKQFAPLEESLVGLGVTRPAQLAHISNSHAVRSALNISPAAYEQLRRLSRLIDRFDLKAEGVGAYKVDIVEALVSLGVATPSEIDAAWVANHADDIKDIASSLSAKYAKSPSPQAIAGWLATPPTP